MTHIKKFVFNPFQVNTYVVYDQSGECVLIDPACSDVYEEKALTDFISQHRLTPVHLLITHAHIDHILGNAFASETYGIPLAAHPDSHQYLTNAKEYALSFGLQLEKVCHPTVDLHDGQLIHFGHSQLKVLHTPGHANGSLCFYLHDEDVLISGDVLFNQSIGRTDLPGGDYDLLKKSIWEKLFVLPDHTRVLPGHGPETTIGNEKITNPFVAIG
ncbi:MAG: MBL fold metallo-hydrolase [Bacteroidales bacterium]|nr:MBL fold metallo-hydrolase [Bacteroidales bacterium]